MAFLHSCSGEGMKSELDLFTLPPTQTSIEGSSFLHYKPVSALSDENDSPLEFLVPSSTEHYIDLAHTMLHLSVQIQPVDPLPAENAKVAPVNNFLHSLFEQIDVFFNQKMVSPPCNAYPYRAYIETLLNYSGPALYSHLTAGLWYTDTAGNMDASPTVPNGAQGANKGLLQRQYFTSNGQTLDLIGHLHCDVFNQGKFLINGVEMRVRLVRSKDAFCLMDFSDDGKFTVRVKEATLIVRRAKISPGILLAHANALAKTTAKYPITRVEVKSFTMHRGVQGDTLDNVFLGQLPKRIILGFVKNRAFNGNRQLNPYNFEHFSTNFLSLYVDGMQIPSRPLQPRFTGENKTYIDSFHTLFTGTGIHFLNEGINIDRTTYPLGFCLFAFDLTPDLSAHFSSHWNLVRSGSVRIEVRFANALTETINCIVYAEFDNMLEIDANRQIVTDFNA